MLSVHCNPISRSAYALCHVCRPRPPKKDQTGKTATLMHGGYAIPMAEEKTATLMHGNYAIPMADED